MFTQVLLFLSIIAGGELTGITKQDLRLSIGSASFNCIIQLFRLKLESTAVEETFVQYSLNCITARFGWVPFSSKLKAFTKSHEPIILNYDINYTLPLLKRLDKKERKNSAVLKVKFDGEHIYSHHEVEVSAAVSSPEQEYLNIMKWNKNDSKKTSFGSMPIKYEFSSLTVNKLITLIKELPVIRKFQS